MLQQNIRIWRSCHCHWEVTFSRVENVKQCSNCSVVLGLEQTEGRCAIKRAKANSLCNDGYALIVE